jgi:hypothetical protein
MSGFDTSQPITEETILRDADLEEQIVTDPPQGDASEDTDSVDADELGDATPGPR